MAKTSAIQRNLKRIKLAKKFRKKRENVLTKIQIRFDSSIKNVIKMPDTKNWVRRRKFCFGGK